jgi:hypothetical protein
MKTYLLLLLILTNLISFSQNDNLSLKIINQKHLSTLPSSSGVEIVDGKIYVVGDDSPFLFELNKDFSIIAKHKITGNDSTQNGRVPKEIKSDFESMAYFSHKNKKYLAVLSSGSKKITRDSIHIISIRNKQLLRSKNIRQLFEKIGNKAGFSKDDEINMEALAISDSLVIMLQRGNNNENLVVAIDRNSFMDYVFLNKQDLPKFNIYRFQLPVFENTISGFSGACILPNRNGILFTASLEASTDAYSDGEVLGSYVGIIEFKNFEKGILQTNLVKNNNEILKTKLEGISLMSVKKNKATLICVSDNDDGTSWIFEIEFPI